MVGLWGAIWLLSEELCWPWGAEFDIMEYRGSILTDAYPLLSSPPLSSFYFSLNDTEMVVITTEVAVAASIQRLVERTEPMSAWPTRFTCMRWSGSQIVSPGMFCLFIRNIYIKRERGRGRGRERERANNI